MKPYIQPDKGAKNRAGRIASELLQDLTPGDIKIIENTTLALLDLWKNEFGLPRECYGVLALLDADTLSDNQRRARIKPLKAWEAAPPGIDTPIDLFMEIFAKGHLQLPGASFIYCLAWLILFSDKLNEPKFWPSMIEKSLWIADLKNQSLKSSLATYRTRAVGELERRKPFINQTLANKEAGNASRAKVYALAEQYLDAGKTPRNIISLIAPKVHLSTRQVRTHLQAHPSANWMPKTKKKK